MKTRDIKELLILLRDNIDLIGGDLGYITTSGLCLLAPDLEILKIINEAEAILIDEYLCENLPPSNPLHGHVWQPCEKAPRLDWLYEQIAKL